MTILDLQFTHELQQDSYAGLKLLPVVHNAEGYALLIMFNSCISEAAPAYVC